MLENVRIAEVTPTDLPQVLAVERAAFGGDDEAELVQRLLDDPSAQPLLSLLAWVEDEAVGHILFTAASIDGPSRPVSVAILAPLAVVPDAQRQGVGGRLIEHGLRAMASRGEGQVPFHFVGKHRRIRLDDLLAYKNRRDGARRETLKRLTRESQDMGLEY